MRLLFVLRSDTLRQTLQELAEQTTGTASSTPAAAATDNAGAGHAAAAASAAAQEHERARREDLSRRFAQLLREFDNVRRGEAQIKESLRLEREEHASALQSMERK